MLKRKRRFKSKMWTSVGRVRKSRCSKVWFCLNISVILPYLPSITECNIKCSCPYLVSTLILQNCCIWLQLNSTFFILYSSCVPPSMDAAALTTGAFATWTQMCFVLWFQLWLFKSSAMNTSEMSSIVGVLWAMFLSVRFIVRYAVSHSLVFS